MTTKKLFLTLACLQYLQFTAVKGTYVILAPAKVRPGMDYSVSVEVLNLQSSCAKVTVSAAIVRRTNNSVVAFNSTFLVQDSSGTIVLRMPATMKSDEYRLNVTGSGSGLTFTNSTLVTYTSKAMSIFVQTDKAIYKPGQTVQFRVFAIYPTLLMYTGWFDVDVLDGNGNKIKQWKQVSGPLGVFTQSLELSAQPVLGTWTIRVTAGNEQTEKSFTVAEYVLPQFEVKVQLPSYVVETDTAVPVVVKATYTYGKPVSGPVTLNVTVDNDFFSGTVSSVQQTANLNSRGEAEMTVLVSDLGRLSSWLAYQAFRFTAVVRESLTGISLNGTASVTVYPRPYNLDFPSTNPPTFKPRLDYVGYVRVTQPDGVPVTSLSGTQLTIEATVTAVSRSRTVAVGLTLDAQGIAEFRFTVPSNATSVSLQVSFRGISAYSSLSQSYSPSNQYIQLYLRNSSVLRAGGRAMFQAKSTEQLSILYCQVLSRGTIVLSWNPPLSLRTTLTYTFDLALTSGMAPQARLVCYYVRNDTEVVTDSLSFDVEGLFTNEVSVTVSREEAQPAENVSVTVRARPRSTGCLLAVDQSVLLLKSGNDVTADQVISDIKTYDSRGDGGLVPLPVDDFGPLVRGRPVAVARRRRSVIRFPINFGGSDASTILTNAGMVWMSDAIIYRRVVQFPVRRVFAQQRAKAAVPGGPPPLATINEASLAQVERVRTEFPETWIFSCLNVNANGVGNLTTTVPDTITSWIVSAFAVHTGFGLGVAPTTAKFRVFRPFFVNLNLPYSVVRGEQVVIQVIVFNYLDTAENVRVTLLRSQKFSNIQIDTEGNEFLVNDDQTIDITVPFAEGKSVFFPILPTALGNVQIEVAARSSRAADAIRRFLLVKPEGVAKEFSVSVLVDLKSSSSFSQTVPVVALPPNLVPDSTRARITAIGDLMGPTINGLEKLLQMPTGCGEQNLLGLAPDVFVSLYLQATGQLSGDIAQKAVRFMEIGYQRQLTYQRTNGSFSAFGNSDSSGSSWLTAMTFKTFEHAKPFIFVDPVVISRAVTWLLTTQADNGSFSEPGRVIHRDMQGGSSSGDSLTAYILISLLELKDLPMGLNQSVTLATRKAADYLKQRLPQISDDYVLAITTYALTLARDPAADAAFNRLLTTAVTSNGLRYWHKPATQPPVSATLWYSPQAAASDVEMTSYVLLTYAALNDFIGGLDVMKWIALQRNPYGGYSSTQDTVLALQALSQYARLAFSRTFNMAVSVTAGDFSRQFTINQGNALVLQSAELMSVPSSLTVTATGSGTALVSFDVFFNVKAEVEVPTFSVSVVLQRDEVNFLQIYTCISWLANGTSGMAVQEVGIPSGFSVSVESVARPPVVKRIELQDGKVILYFDEITPQPVCTTLDATRTGLVAKSQPVPVRAYDYYRPENQATVFYRSAVLEAAGICNVCQDCQCP